MLSWYIWSKHQPQRKRCLDPMHPTNSQKSHWGADPEIKKRIRRLICFVSHLKISGLIHEKAAQLLEKGPLFFFWFIFFECREPKVHRSTPLGLVCLIISVIKEPTWCTCWFSACQPLWWECPGSLFLPNQPRQCKPVVKSRTLFIIKTIPMTHWSHWEYKTLPKYQNHFSSKFNFIFQLSLSHWSSPPLFPPDQKTSQLKCYKNKFIFKDDNRIS